ncbi:MAG: DNA translocase FtsK 4TM domain-containing protein, partial [Planctomycetes bacterium]|nr:DNA translocase FtsK 4TM domain-containing protein [Planctomycetota bacterium]
MDFQRIRTDLLALVLLAVALFLGLSLVSYDPADAPSQTVYPGRAETANLCGPVGAIVAHHFRTAIGFGAYFVLLSLITTDLRLFSCREISGRIFRLTGVIL